MCVCVCALGGGGGSLSLEYAKIFLLSPNRTCYCACVNYIGL